jgi:hypothetical protein
MRSLLLVENLDLHPGNQYILVREIPSCLCFAKMWGCQVSRRLRLSPKYLTLLSGGICTSFIWTGGHVARHVGNVTWTDLVSLAFICHIFSQDWIARREAWSSWEAVAGSQSVVTTAVSSAKVAVMESGEVGRSAVYRRYSKGSRTLLWGTPALTGVRFVGSVLTFMMKWRLDRWELRIKK